jgi:multiple sugar transport system substrate-binding protein
MDCYVIWKFAENIEGAKKFLVDYVDDFHAAFDASKYYNFPCFTSTVPDLQQLLANDPHKPAGKYKVLGDALQWAVNVGYPGYANAAIDEIFGTWVINTMFAKAATGTLSPEEAIAEANARVHQVFAKWHDRHLV